MEDSLKKSNSLVLFSETHPHALLSITIGLFLVIIIMIAAYYKCFAHTPRASRFKKIDKDRDEVDELIESIEKKQKDE